MTNSFSNFDLPVDVVYPPNVEEYPEFDYYWYETGFLKGFAVASVYILDKWEELLVASRGNKSVALGRFLPWLTELGNSARNV